MKKAILAAVIILVCLSFSIFIFGKEGKTVFSESIKTVIIDAGHGFPDGGAVAGDGTVESEINLQIAKALQTDLENAGYRCIMTRQDENSIFTEGNTIHAKKVSDIQNRVKLMNRNSDALVVSIHMNTYPNAKVYGTQVFYSAKSEFAKNISGEIQNAVNLKFQPENNKDIKCIPKNIYLFNNIKNDAVLIECGFLTNPNDLNNFKSSEYIQQFSEVLSETIIFKLSGSDKYGN